jgi:DNA-binding response OmpR family regulator
VSDTIVLAEDDADLRAIYAECLRRDGYQVWEAGDGAEALDLVRAQVPKLLIIDFWMPILNGFEVIERLVDAPEAVGMKVVVLTHQNDSDTRLEGFALGIRDYWTKDISLDTLCRRVRELLEAFSISISSPTSPAS